MICSHMMSIRKSLEKRRRGKASLRDSGKSRTTPLSRTKPTRSVWKTRWLLLHYEIKLSQWLHKSFEIAVLWVVHREFHFYSVFKSHVSLLCMHFFKKHPLFFFSSPHCKICISASSHRRRTMHQRERRIQLVQKKQMLQAVVMRMKVLWWSTRRTRGEELNEKQRSPERWDFTHMGYFGTEESAPW